MNYNDRDSSPDYDSHPEDLPQQKQRVRGGTRKIVGNADTQTTSQESILVDFGHTLRLTPENSRPNTAAGHRSLLNSSGDGSSGGRRSPFDSLGQPAPFAEVSRPNAPHSPARTPEKRSPIDRPTLLRPQSYAWRPQSYVGSQGLDGLSAEDFVRQRASMAMQPRGYVPQRSFSSGRVDQLKGDQMSRPVTPPSPSSRKLQKKPTSRQSSGNSIDYSAHLSAREQEMVAKMTGGPLLSNINQKNRTPDPSVGLIGAIEARDQEKENIKKGLQGKMLQAAIDQRYRESRTAHNQQMQRHRRTQSQHMAQPPQQYQTMAPYQQPAQHSYWDITGSRLQNQQAYQQSVYSMQQQQAMQMGNMTEIPDTMTQAGYSSRPLHQRSQTTYSQYGGFYAPQR